MDVQDIETAEPTVPKPLSTVQSMLASKAFLEAAALLLLWSLLVINEGAIRVADRQPASADLSSGRPPIIYLFLGGLFEVFFGLLGAGLGAAALLRQSFSAPVTKAVMIIQTILGYYVFVVFVFIAPGVQASDMTSPSLVGLSLGQSKFITVLGILTSFHFCLALQGGQFVFMARLVCTGTGNDFLKQATGAKMRAFFWNGNLAFSGLWTFITGAIVNANVGGGRLSMPFVSPPNVGVLPGFTIFVGLFMLLWGVVGIAMAAMSMAPSWYFIGSALVYVFGLLNFGIVQLGLLPEPPSGAVALHNGLTFMVVFMGPYFVSLAHKEANGQDQ